MADNKMAENETTTANEGTREVISNAAKLDVSGVKNFDKTTLKKTTTSEKNCLPTTEIIDLEKSCSGTGRDSPATTENVTGRESPATTENVEKRPETPETVG